MRKRGVTILITTILILSVCSYAMAERRMVAVSVSCDDPAAEGNILDHIIRELRELDDVVIVKRAPEAQAELTLSCFKAAGDRVVISVVKVQHFSSATVNPRTMKDEYFVDRTDHYVSVVAKDELKQFSLRAVADFNETFLGSLPRRGAAPAPK